MSGQLYNVSTCGLATFDGFFTEAQCQYYIDYYNRCKTAGMGRTWNHPGKEHGIADDERVTIWPPESDNMVDSDEPDVIHGSQVNLNYFQDTFMNSIIPKYVEVQQGLKDCEWTIRDSKIQKTVPSGGYHAWHVEKPNMLTSDRLFVVQLYLNTVEEGGETEFLVQQKRVGAVQGRLVIFPANYTHLHRGNPPLSGPKYVMNMWATLIH